MVGRLGGADIPTLDTHLEPLRPFIGKIWRAEFKNSTPEKPVIDVASWERALNGKAIRITHSINDGAYGGETLVVWDAEKKVIQYHYFTTAGFKTVGTITIDGTAMTTHEFVSGSTDGITEVRGKNELKSDGTLFVKTEYLKDSKWIAGREALYKEAPGAVVRFR
jgi:hypothetical protein